MRFKITPLEERIVLDANLIGDLNAAPQTDLTNGPVDLMRLATSISDKPAIRPDGTSVEPAVAGNTIYVPTDKDITEVKFDLSGGDVSISSMKSLKIFGSINNPDNLNLVQGTLFFTSEVNGIDVLKMYKNGVITNITGTDQITGLLQLGKGINPTVVGSQIYFVAKDSTHGTELWVSNAQGVTLIRDINTGTASSNPKHLTAIDHKRDIASYDGTLYFSANDGSHGREPWGSNTAGVYLLKDINPGVGDSNPNNFTQFENKAFFSATNGSSFKLWRSLQGTTSTTNPVNAPTNNFGDKEPFEFNVRGKELWFLTNGPGADKNIWVSNGPDNLSKQAPLILGEGVDRFNYPNYARAYNGEMIWDSAAAYVLESKGSPASSHVAPAANYDGSSFIAFTPPFPSKIGRVNDLNGKQFFTVESPIFGINLAIVGKGRNDGIRPTPPFFIFFEPAIKGVSKSSDLIKMNNFLYLSASSNIVSFDGKDVKQLQINNPSSKPNFINLTPGKGSSDSILFALSNDGQDRTSLWVGQELKNKVGNDAPVSHNDVYKVKGQILNIPSEEGVLKNDVDPEGKALAAKLLKQPKNGTVFLQNNGSFLYFADPGFRGVDTFQYRSFDGKEFSKPVTVKIQVEKGKTDPDLFFSNVIRETLADFGKIGKEFLKRWFRS